MKSSLLFKVIVLYIGFIHYSFKADSQIGKVEKATNYISGETFAEVVMEDTAGNKISTHSLKGKTVYVDFWFTACAPCIYEIPFAKKLQQQFANDTNIVFLNICIESIDRKEVWKQMIRNHELGGVHLFYARNRPQKVNLLRKYNIMFPTYLLLNKDLQVVGYDVPRPSQGEITTQAINNAAANIPFSQTQASFEEVDKHRL